MSDNDKLVELGYVLQHNEVYLKFDKDRKDYLLMIVGRTANQKLILPPDLTWDEGKQCILKQNERVCYTNIDPYYDSSLA